MMSSKNLFTGREPYFISSTEEHFTSFFINAVWKSSIGYDIFSVNFVWNKLGNYNWETKGDWVLFI